MRYYLICFLIISLCCKQQVAAQIVQGAFGYYSDAALFAQSTAPMGSARMQGLGGANVAVGADASSAVSNPAGLGFLTKGQFNLGLAYNNFSANTNYIGTDTQDNTGYLKLNNLSYLTALGQKGSYRSSFAISVMRTNNFQNSFSYSGVNTRSTLADKFTLLAAGTEASIFDNEAATGEILDLPSLAYSNFVISPFTNDTKAYYTEFRDVNDNLVAPIRQQETVSSKGGETTFNLAYGGNFNDKFYFGVGMGITTLRYTLNRTYRENLTRLAAPNELQEFSLINNRSVSGGGINLNLGFIVRPIDMLRIGLSLTTPTVYGITEVENNTLSATSRGFQPTSSSTIPTNFRYFYSTPLKVNLGTAVFFKKYGFATIEAEWVNYRGMSVSSAETSIVADNQTIKNVYSSALNIRGGIEGRLNQFRARVGAAYYQNPLKVQDNVKRDVLSLTGGLGLYMSTFALDLGFTYTPSKTVYTPYSLPNSDFYFSSQSKNTQITGILSATFFF